MTSISYLQQPGAGEITEIEGVQFAIILGEGGRHLGHRIGYVPILMALGTPTNEQLAKAKEAIHFNEPRAVIMKQADILKLLPNSNPEEATA